MRKSFVFGRSFFLLTICALSAMTAGILSAALMDLYLISLMRQFLMVSVSIVVRLAVAVLPFLIAAYAVSIEQWNILLITVFLRFFCWGFASGICIRAFGSAAWLVQPLWQFADNGTLMLFCLYCFMGEKRKMAFLLSLLGILLTVMVDQIIIWPFFISLLSF